MGKVASTYKEWVGTTEMPKRPTRLELHRLKFRAAEGKHPLLPWTDLSEFERGLFSKQFFQSLFLDRQRRDPYEILRQEYAGWGIMCPHPQHLRLYGGKVKSDVPTGDHRWYLCKCCDGYVPNDVPPTWFVGKATGA